MLKNITEFSAQTESRGLSSHQAVAVMNCMPGGLPKVGRILLVPSDTACCYSYGDVTISYPYHRLSREAKVCIVSAVGTHGATSRREQVRSFGEDVSEGVFLYHDQRKDTVPVGTVPGAYCGQVPGGRYTSDIDAEVSRCVVDGSFDLILSTDQVVPHEVIGMSNYTKSILVGLGGRPMTNGIHMLGVLCNLETIMGNTDMPVRAVFGCGEEYLLRDAPLAYILIVVLEQERRTALHGIFTRAPGQVYKHVTALAKRRCITRVERRVKKAVVYPGPEEFSTIWVGSKAIYRTRICLLCISPSP